MQIFRVSLAVSQFHLSLEGSRIIAQIAGMNTNTCHSCATTMQEKVVKLEAIAMIKTLSRPSSSAHLSVQFAAALTPVSDAGKGLRTRFSKQDACGGPHKLWLR